MARKWIAFRWWMVATGVLFLFKLLELTINGTAGMLSWSYLYCSEEKAGISAEISIDSAEISKANWHLGRKIKVSSEKSNVFRKMPMGIW